MLTPPRDKASDLSKLWLPWASIFCALLFIGTSAFCVICVPASRALHFPITFSHQGYETNAMGTITSTFAVSNGGAEKVYVWAGIEFGTNAIEFGGSLPKRLESGG